MANEMIVKHINLLHIDKQIVDYTAGTNYIPLKFIFDDMEIPADATASIYIKKPSGSTVFNACTVDTDSNAIIVMPTAQMFIEPGQNPAQIQLISGGKVLNSFMIIFNLQGIIASDDATESTDEFTAFEQTMRNATTLTYSVVSDYVEEHGIVTGATPAQVEQMNASTAADAEQAARIAALEGNVTGPVATSAQLAALTARVQELEALISGIATNAADISALDTRVSDIENGFSGGDFANWSNGQ